MARRILAGEPVPEISPLTKTLVSITKRGRSVLLSTPAFSDRFHSLRYCALDLCSSDASVGRLRFIDRLPGINAPEGPADDQRLCENPADGGSLLEGFSSHFCMGAGRNPDVNLSIECACHCFSALRLYHYTMVHEGRGGRWGRTILRFFLQMRLHAIAGPLKIAS